MGKGGHSHILEAGYEGDVRVGSALIDMYAKCGSIEDAALVFDSLKERDVITWNVMIGAYAGSGRGVEAYELYLKMKEEGFQPDAVTYMSLLNDCASTGALEFTGISWRKGTSRMYEWAVLLFACTRSVGALRTLLWFLTMKERNIITWNAIGAYAGSGLGVEAYDLYVKMKEEGFQPMQSLM